MMRRRSLLLFPAVAVLSGCAGGPPAPAIVNLTIKAGPDINRNAAGTPLAVAVRVYALTGRARFTSADAYALMDRDRAVLADQGMRAEEVVIRPGETRNITLAPKPDVRFIGVTVLFQDIDRSQWRAVTGIAPSGVTKLALVIGGNHATLEAV
jgi:type VI secretion system protein VasD